MRVILRRVGALPQGAIGTDTSSDDRDSSRPSVTPTGSSSKAQGKRSAALGTEVPSGSTLKGSHICAKASPRRGANGRCTAPSGPADPTDPNPGLRCACPGLWSRTPLGSIPARSSARSVPEYASTRVLRISFNYTSSCMGVRPSAPLVVGSGASESIPPALKRKHEHSISHES